MRIDLAAQLRSYTFILKTWARASSPLLMFAAIVGLQNGITGAAWADTDGSALSTVTDASDSVLDTINAILRPVSLIAIVVCGLAGAFGKMEWGTVGKVAAGILIANSAVTILDFFGGGGAIS